MTSSQTTSLIPSPFIREEIADHDFVYSRQRLKNQLFEAVLQAFVERFRRNGLSKVDLAAAMKRDPSQITRWLKGPGNWELRTVSDLMRALRANLRVSFELYEDIRPNYEHELAMDDEPIDSSKAEILADLEIRDIREVRRAPASIVAFLRSPKLSTTSPIIDKR